MRRLFASVTALVTVGATGCFGAGFAAADDTQAGWTPDHGAPDNGPPPLGTPGRAYALGGAHVLGIPYDEYIKRTGADWFPGLDRQIVDYPAGQVQGHALERLFPGISRLDDDFPGLGIDGPSIGESVDEGEGNLEAAIRNGGPGTAIGLSEGAMVLDAVQAKLANDPTAPPPNQLSFATYGDPLAEHAFGESFLTQMFPVGSVVPVTRLPHAGSGGEPVRHLPIRLGLRQHRRLAGQAGQLDGRSPTRSWASRPVTPRWRSPTRAWCRRRTSGRPSTPRVRRRRRT